MGTASDRLRARGWDVLDDEVLDGDRGDLELTSGEQLRALTDGFRLRLLTSIAREPGSARELADRFDVPTTRLYHHLDLLEEHGFIEVVATRKSGARTERCYGQPPWRSMRPSREMVDADDRSDLGEALRAMSEVVGVTLEEGIRTGAFTIPPAGEEAGPDMVTWSTARLTEAQHAAFSAELTDLVGRIVEASEANAERADGVEEPLSSVLVYLVLAPDVMAPD